MGHSPYSSHVMDQRRTILQVLIAAASSEIVRIYKMCVSR